MFWFYKPRLNRRLPVAKKRFHQYGLHNGVVKLLKDATQQTV